MIRPIRHLFANTIFLRYVCTGGLNTVIHWFFFFLLTICFSFGQGIANIFAFLVAVTFSYLVNAKWTFRATTSWRKYVIYTLFMAFIAGLVGWGGQMLNLHPVLTLCLFSCISLVCGFIYSRFIVFRD
ncbi:GtrA family protein [Budvicia diplopodorum]|uniref:GtrA family protein n=1 Tax=Budvicia diplopodorum TaxID=1119056 RepID=UPI0013575FA4|nr:GtrA family protein [Budvicia diplopodorum]